MKGWRGFGWIIGAVVLMAAALVCLHVRRDEGDGAVVSPRPTSAAKKAVVLPAVEPAPVVASGASAEAEPQPATEEVSEVEENEKRVAAFDAMIDRWMEPVSKGVTTDDVTRFVRAFDAVPTDRKEECLQRALNLIPDENVMLLAGILMDKRQDKERITMVFNDILNRDDSVKQPILQQVYQDKTHPCWEDAAWIFCVTK